MNSTTAKVIFAMILIFAAGIRCGYVWGVAVERENKADAYNEYLERRAW